MTPTNTPAPSEAAAIAQPSVEPVAWQHRFRTGMNMDGPWGAWRNGRAKMHEIQSYYEERALPPSSEVERLTNENEVLKYKLDQAVNTVQPMLMRRAETAEATIRSLEERLAEAERRAMVADVAKAWPYGTHFSIEHDGFAGTVIGWYVRLDGKAGVVGQIDGARIVHVYGDKWLTKLKEGQS